jgi:CheY-like chemotaxis protein
MAFRLNLSDPAMAPAGRPGFVLVVDDEPFFAEVAMEILLHAGYFATFALDARAALREIEANPAIDLLLTDVVMPGMDGFTLAAKASEMRPGLRILYSSAHVELARDLSAAGDAKQSIVEKPYRQDLLIDAIKKALASASA